MFIFHGILYLFTFFQAAKVFVKNMMKYVPTIGWAWSCSDIIFLHRNWQKDQTIMESQVKEFFDYPYPVWVSRCFIPSSQFALRS